MTTPAIEVQDVWKTYGEVTAVRELSLHVPAHSVYGFLGPNGAGKTTTIRMILGIQRPDRGDVTLFGQSLSENRLELLRRIGSLVETPSLYPHLSGRENLEVHRRLLRLPSRHRRGIGNGRSRFGRLPSRPNLLARDAAAAGNRVCAPRQS